MIRAGVTGYVEVGPCELRSALFSLSLEMVLADGRDRAVRPAASVDLLWSVCSSGRPQPLHVHLYRLNALRPPPDTHTL